MPSAEHLLSAQEQQHTLKVTAAVLPQHPYFGTSVKCSVVPTTKSPCVPPWIIMLEFLEGVVVPARDVAALCEGCNSVPRAIQLLAARHDKWACCSHRFVPHICYIVAKITLLSLCLFGPEMFLPPLFPYLKLFLSSHPKLYMFAKCMTTSEQFIPPLFVVGEDSRHFKRKICFTLVLVSRMAQMKYTYKSFSLYRLHVHLDSMLKQRCLLCR